DGGATWSTPVLVNDDGTNASHFMPGFAVDQTTGAVGATWYDTRGDPTRVTARYYGSVSVDGGDTWSPNFPIANGPSNATVALIGDWGTGTADAITLLEAVGAHRPDVILHLGDIYYSGTPDETHKFFLKVLNSTLGRDENPIAVYTLTGNHDMYSGGVGYYQLLPELNPPPVFQPEQAQPASYFSLRSLDGAWQFLALDTGLHDHDPFSVNDDITYLEESEEAWHIDKIAQWSARGGRTILLSHHQLFSAFELIGGKDAQKPAGQEAANPKLLASFRKFQEAAEIGGGDIAAWFWGHEHNLCVYEPYLGLAKGRCLGHGAIPAFTEQDPYAVVASLPNPPALVGDPRNPGEPLKLGVVDQAYAHGFVIVRLDDRDRSATVSYYQETDYTTPMFVERL
ncbi:MAG: metallophosphoesterase, partial [Thermoanaerobaculia bacterium]|nr:metallophosphoesterase [Thermoanaerobaculia bacterium]